MKIGSYRHFKGTTVEVVGIALHSKTMEEMVVYKHFDSMKGKKKNTLWVRPKKMFLEKVEVNGKKESRFKFLK